ncbi:MAG TPA: SMP-30/gluconolactonase/LRE family protein [Jatrophihabitantaceae bacterium]|jgi:sugar lactone lactonase YvrE|nr:SMP-30/gluconolactonase/LRE family protein [Jatrophihabitantaceae bacterium]
MTVADQVTGRVTHHGEGPVWDASLGRLHFVDMMAGDLLTLDPDGGPTVERLHVGEVAAVWRPRIGGGGIVGVQRGFALIEPDGTVATLPVVFTDPGIRMNEGGCDPQGRFYCGTMAYAETPGAGTLYRLDLDATVATVLSGVSISNGIVWSLDGSTVYYVDSASHEVVAYDFDADAGTFHGKRTVVRIEPESASPDGMTIDAEGFLWVALWAGGAVRRYSPSGELADVIELPATQVSACAFGGPELDTLYITTSRQGLADGEQPAAGALFAAVPGVRGAPVLPFGG